VEIVVTRSSDESLSLHVKLLAMAKKMLRRLQVHTTLPAYRIFRALDYPVDGIAIQRDVSGPHHDEN